MRFLIIALCVLGVAYAEVSLHAVFQAKWNNFKASHGKTYHRDEEHQRLNAFLRNTLHIESHNEKHARGEESYTLGHNAFSDMPLEEFKSKMTGLSMPTLGATSNATTYEITGSPAPASGCDWTRHIPPVKHQQSCGSCYAFASLAPLEAQLYKKFNRVISLSEQEIVDCSSKHGNAGCNGGFMDGTYTYIKQAGGLHTESNYGYNAKENTCRTINKQREGQIKSYVALRGEDKMTDALAKVGPVAIALQAGVRSFQMYSTGVYDDANCGKGNIDHGVTAVGYGTADGKNYYLVRNSWGNTWGEKGYMRIGRKVRHVTDYVYYPVV